METDILRSENLPKIVADVMEVMNIGLLRLATLPQVITEVVDIGKV